MAQPTEVKPPVHATMRQKRAHHAAHRLENLARRQFPGPVERRDQERRQQPAVALQTSPGPGHSGIEMSFGTGFLSVRSAMMPS